LSLGSNFKQMRHNYLKIALIILVFSTFKIASAQELESFKNQILNVLESQEIDTLKGQVLKLKEYYDS